MRGRLHGFSLSAFFKPRWSTAGLLVSTVLVGAIAYHLGGQRAPTKTNSIPPPAAAKVQEIFPNRMAVRENVSTKPALTELPFKKFEERWQFCVAQPRTPAVDEEKAQCLAQLAEIDPRRALQLALEETDFKLREKLRAAVLRGWAARMPDEATVWVLNLPQADRRAAFEAVFTGAAGRPEDAARLGRQLGERFPEFAGEYGQLVIAALTTAGAYESAMRFAAADGTSNREAWLNATFFHWASHQPEAALKGLSGVTDAASRNVAFQGVVAGWAEANPTAFADYMMRFSPGEDRTQALTQTLPEWVRRDPMAASEWMIRHFTPSSDLDPAVAAVAALPNLIGTRPEIAVGWAENISEPLLRAETFRKIARDWSLRDAEAVRRFLAETPHLAEDERKAFLEGLASPGS